MRILRRDGERGSDDPPAPSEMEGFWSVRRRRRWVWLLLLGYVPAVSATMAVHEVLGRVVAVGGMMAFLVAAVLHARSRCPRCGGACFQDELWPNPWVRRCLQCRTRLYWSDEHLGVTTQVNNDSNRPNVER